MDALMTLAGNITLSEILLIIAAIIFIIQIVNKGYKLITNFHDSRQEHAELLRGIQEDVINLIDEQKNIQKDIEFLKENQEDFKEQQEGFEEKQNDYLLSTSRDRLLQSYRYYTNLEKNPTQSWSDMEKEAFDKLFKSYEKMGGDGLLHSVVEPAMAQLNIVKMDDEDGLDDLMRSRKG